MNKNKGINNTNKLLITLTVVVSIAFFALVIIKTDVLNNVSISSLLKASISERSYTEDDKRNALVETANAYQRKNENIQYDTLRRTYLTTPEDSTADDVHYVDGASFVYSIYKQAFDINIAPTSETLYNYAINNKSNTNYIVRALNASEIQSYSNVTAMYNSLSADLKVGDIIVMSRKIEGNINYHAAMVISISGTTVNLIQAAGKNLYSTQYSNNAVDEENIKSLSRPSDIYGTYSSYYETNEQPAITQRFNLLNMMENWYTTSSMLGYAVIRPLGTNGTKYLTYDGSTEDISLTDSAKARLEYKGIDITKTSNKHDNITVNLGDTITYTISIKNTGSTNYSGMDLTEEISNTATITNANSGTIDGNTISWTNISVAAGATQTISYTVKVKNQANFIGLDLISTGSLDGISTGEIDLFIYNTLTDSEITTLNSGITSGSTEETISSVYKSITGLSFQENSSNFDIDSIIDNDEEDSSSNLYSEMVIGDMFYLNSSDDFLRKNYIKLSYDDFNLEEFDENQKHSITNNNLIYGDILILPDNKYIYTSSGLLSFSNQNNISTSNIKMFLDSMHINPKFAILRPSIVMPSLVDVYSTNKKTSILLNGTLELGTRIYELNEFYEGLNSVTWASSNTNIATVDNQGVVTGVAEGDVTITATTSNGRSGSIELSVKTSLSSVNTLSSIKGYEYHFTDVYTEEDIVVDTPEEFIRDNITAGISESVDYVLMEFTTTSPLANYEITQIENMYGTMTSSDEISNIITLYPGDNKLTVRVTAENGDYKDYKLNLYKRYTDSNKLSSLSVYDSDLFDDNNSPTVFDPSNTTYRATVITDELTPGAVYIEANPELFGAKVEITSPETLVYGENIYKITVYGVDESTGSTTYTLKVTLKEALSADASLAGILVNGNRISDFDEDTSEYTYSLGVSVCDIAITFEKRKSTQTITTIEEPESGTLCTKSFLTYVFEVTAEDGVTTRLYTLYITKTGTVKAKLANLEVSSSGGTTYTLSPSFDPDVFEYEVEVPYDVESVTITGTESGNITSSNITGPDHIDVGNNNTFKYTVISYTGGEEGTSVYTIKIKRLASTDNKLSNLYVEGYTINPVFNPDTLNYTLTVPNSTTSINIVASYDGAYREIEGAGTKTLTNNTTQCVIKVTPTGGETREYTIAVTKLSETTFSDLTVKDGYIYLTEETTLGTLVSKIGESNNPTIKDKNGSIITDTNKKIATGNTANINDQTYTIILLGDYDLDGVVDLYDVNSLYYDIMNDSIPTNNEAKRKAGDYDQDIAIDLYDVNALYDWCMDN